MIMIEWLMRPTIGGAMRCHHRWWWFDGWYLGLVMGCQQQDICQLPVVRLEYGVNWMTSYIRILVQ